MTKHGFDLEERTLIFAKKTIKLCKNLPNDLINRELVVQLVRSSSSIGANYREANDASSKKDFIHKINITKREAKETQYWLQLLAEVTTEARCEIDALLQEAVELRKIFSCIASRSQ